MAYEATADRLAAVPEPRDVRPVDARDGNWRSEDLTAQIEPFDSFWQAPEEIEKGYYQFYQLYRHNFLKYLPQKKDARILVVSCGPGYFVNLLVKEGYSNILGIDSYPEKIRYATEKKLPCRTERALEFLQTNTAVFDMIFCEQELNHLTKKEMVMFLRLCWRNLAPGGELLVYGLNGANPITAAENLAHNIDHYNTFTEYSLEQVLKHCGYSDITILPIKLYVFYNNPLNYLLIALEQCYTLFFRFSFRLYGKSVKILTKKIAASCKKNPAP